MRPRHASACTEHALNPHPSVACAQVVERGNASYLEVWFPAFNTSFYGTTEGGAKLQQRLWRLAAG